MEDEDWGVRRYGIDLVERRQAALGELEFRPAADHAYPLGGRRPLGLRTQHAQRIRERGHTIPPQFEIVVEPAANRVDMRIVQPWDDGPSADINHLGGIS